MLTTVSFRGIPVYFRPWVTKPHLGIDPSVIFSPYLFQMAPSQVIFARDMQQLEEEVAWELRTKELGRRPNW